MRKKLGSATTSKAKVLRLVKKLVAADAIDHAYLARLEQRIPESTHRHPDENTSVGIQEIYRRRSPATSKPATRISRLHNILTTEGIIARTSATAPLPSPKPGTIRLFRAETDRCDRSGEFKGWQRNTKARGNYFTTSPVVAARFAEPFFAPRGAPLRYVDVPLAVADACRATRPAVFELLDNRSQRLPLTHSVDELHDTEYYLDAEWAGRVVSVPAVVESGNAISSSNVFDASEWWFGREQLVSDPSSTMQAQLSVQYVAGPAVDHPGTKIPKAWTGITRSQNRHFANADVMIPIDGDSVMFIRAGVEAHSVELLLTILTGKDSTKNTRIDFVAVEVALANVDHLISGESAAVLQGTSQHTRKLDAVEVLVPRSSLVSLAHVIARSDAAPANASSIGWTDEASVLRKFLSSQGSVPLRSAQWGCLNITIIDDATFAAMRQDIVSTTLPTNGRDGNPERVAVQMTRSLSGTPRRIPRRRQAETLKPRTS